MNVRSALGHVYIPIRMQNPNVIWQHYSASLILLVVLYCGQWLSGTERRQKMSIPMLNGPLSEHRPALDSYYGYHMAQFFSFLSPGYVLVK